MVFQLRIGSDGRPFLACLAFGTRHPTGPSTRSLINEYTANHHDVDRPCLPAASRVAHGGRPIGAPLQLNDVSVADRHDHVSDPLIHRTVKLHRLLGAERHDHARPVLDGLLDSASQAASEVASHHVDDCLAAIAELPSSTPYHCASGASTSPKTSRPPAIKASHARRTSSISGLSPIAVIVAHPRADGCGPFALPAVRLRSPDQRTAANTSEHAPPMLSVFGDIRPCSLLFAVL